jgi:hypothetical protein
MHVWDELVTTMMIAISRDFSWCGANNFRRENAESEIAAGLERL